MLSRQGRPDFRTVDRWATRLLRDVGAVHRCARHGWVKETADPHLRQQALRIAREEPLPGLSPDDAVKAVQDVFDAVGDTCPECD